MITTPEQYQAHLHLIQNFNAPQYVVLNPNDKIYKVDLKTREIETPEFLSVQEDHGSEVIYFEVDRFYDFMDLAFTTCIIHYINAEGKAGLYAVPFYDINTKMQERKMIFPWCIEGAASAVEGKITFTMMFYQIEAEEIKNENNQIVDSKLNYLYRISTLSATTKILKGMRIGALMDSDLTIPTEIPGVTTGTGDLWLDMNNRIQQLQQWQSAIYWTILD